jgi:hypothetical protein
MRELRSEKVAVGDWRCRAPRGAIVASFGELPATDKQMDAHCCDVFELEDGKMALMGIRGQKRTARP